MNRVVRRIAAFTTLFAFLFAQMAVSAYACPAERVADSAATAAPAGDTHCDDLQNPNLCDSHCAYGASAASHAATISFAFVAPSFFWRVEETSVAVTGVRATDEEFLRYEPPAPLTLFGALRI